MKTDENFYNIISSKFTDRQIPLDEENWQSMRKMIDDSRSEKRRTMWLIISISLLLFMGAAFGIYEWSNNATGKQYTMAINNNSIANSLQITTDLNKQTTNEATPLKSRSNQNTNEPDNIIATSNSNVSAQRKVQSSPTTNNISNKISKKKYIGKSAGTKNIQDNNTAGSLVSVVDNPGNAGSPVPGVNEQSNSSAGKGASISSLGKIPMPSNSINIKSTASLTKVSSDKADSAVAGDGLPQRFSDEPRIFRGMTNIFSLELGGEYSGGWEIGSVDQGKGFNVNAGIGYAHYLGSRIFIKTGLLFSTFNNMSLLTYNYQHNVGNVIYDSVITTKRLYFLKLPVQLEYFVGRNKRSSIGAGAEVWFLVGNRGFATTYQQLDNNPPTNMLTYSQNIPLNGYSKINVSGHFLYRYVLSRKFSMYAVFYMELTNMKNNSFFGENIIERTNGIQYTLSYSL